MSDVSDSERRSHVSVLLEQAVDGWMTNDYGFYIDATFGRGGHSELLLSRLSPEGRLLVIDRDPAAIEVARHMSERFAQMEFVHAEFAELANILSARGGEQQVAGILLDLGVSSPQLDDASRGFSFIRDGELDMRMDPTAGISAAEWLADADVEEMTTVFKRFGEERFGRRIATAIAQQREQRPIQTTLQLAEIIEQAIPVKEKGKHPATRTFQAIRIHLNEELQQIEKVLADSVAALKPGGRLAVISFHSLEDRIVKRFMRKQVRGEQLPASLPVADAALNKTMKLVGKAIRADDDEVARNPRSRSAILRVAERL